MIVRHHPRPGRPVWPRFSSKGSGPVPWEHVPNQGFLRALWALALAAERIGETAEHERCAQFLRDSSEEAYTHLSTASASLRR